MKKENKCLCKQRFGIKACEKNKIWYKNVKENKKS